MSQQSLPLMKPTFFSKPTFYMTFLQVRSWHDVRANPLKKKIWKDLDLILSLPPSLTYSSIATMIRHSTLGRSLRCAISRPTEYI